MIADKPGNLTIVSVGDQRNKCRSFPKGMTKVIHPVPSSLVSGGREVIESIQEGMNDMLLFKKDRMTDRMFDL